MSWPRDRAVSISSHMPQNMVSSLVRPSLGVIYTCCLDCSTQKLGCAKFAIIYPQTLLSLVCVQTRFYAPSGDLCRRERHCFATGSSLDDHDDSTMPITQIKMNYSWAWWVKSMTSWPPNQSREHHYGGCYSHQLHSITFNANGAQKQTRTRYASTQTPNAPSPKEPSR